MADDSGQDKTEAPTGKRLGDSRSKGQVARSKELNTFVTLIISSAMFFYWGDHMANDLLQMMKHQFQLSREAVFDPETPVLFLKNAFVEGFIVIMPFMLVLLVVDLMLPLLMGGWNFTLEVLSVNFSKLDPISGFNKIVGIQGLVELVKALVKTVLVGYVAWTLFIAYFDDLMNLSRMEIEPAIHRLASIIVYCVLVLTSTFLLLVLIDVPYQLWRHQKQLKMTKQEVKDEAKDAEGNPEIKGKIRRLQQEQRQRRMMEAVPKADVIVTNPTHFAVALKYDLDSIGAPILVAKGVDLVAAQIRNLGLAANVTLVAAPSLARALYYSTEINQEIPRGLFLAVAQVLAYVFQLRSARQNGWKKPEPPNNISVPDEFKT